MTVEAVDVEKLVRSQKEAVSNFFGTEIPQPGDWLFVAHEAIRQEKLFNAAPFYTPRRQLVEGMTFPGLKSPLDPWLYEQIRAQTVAQDADWLLGEWVLFDIIKRPNYNNGKQMYPDNPRFKEVLATLREQDKIAVPDQYKHVNKDSRFAISADEIDGSKAVVAKAVADILKIDPKQVSTPLYSTFNYIGNLAHPELGQANTSEWLRNTFGHGHRLFGGLSDDGGLSDVNYWRSDVRFDSVGFRLQVSSPSKA